MNIGFLGLGKLGLPVALAVESKGHTIFGWDASPERRAAIAARSITTPEPGVHELLANSTLQLRAPYLLATSCDLIFVAVQTPHDPALEGDKPLPSRRADFDYTYLRQAVRELANATCPVVIISTVLPGTVEREIKPIAPDLRLCYNPFFIAMGGTIRDFLEPEFVLLGVDDPYAAELTTEFYQSLHDRPIKRMRIRDAELTKVAYNTFISQKIVFANTLMEICHRVGGNVDVVTDALCAATDRLISPKYLRGGMGDGGGCHPRDNIALSWLADKLALSTNIFEEAMRNREWQSSWLADIAEDTRPDLPLVLLGKAFKANTDICTGSAAMLLASQLDRPFDHYDPLVDGEHIPYDGGPHLFFIATNHDEFYGWDFRPGDVVLDPWRSYAGAAIDAEYLPIGAPCSSPS